MGSYDFTRDNQSGSGLVQVMAIIASSLVIVLGLIEISLMLTRTTKNTSNKSAFMALTNNVRAALSNELMCATVMRRTASLPILFQPPPASSAAYSAPVQFLYLGDELVMALPTTGVRDPNAGSFVVRGMRLTKILGTTGAKQTLFIGSPPTPVPVDTYRAQLELEVVRSGGSLDGHPMAKAIPMTVSVDAAGSVVQCQAKLPAPRLVTAIGRRSMVTLEAQNCLDPLDVSAGAADERLYLAQTCTDTDRDRLCDGTSSPRESTINHPAYDDPKSIWKDSIPSRRSGVNELAPQAEGRCLFSPRVNNSADKASDIFVLHNDRYPGAEGLGCNKDNGWFLASCMRGNYGLGDMDALTTVDPVGNQICVTNDHTQPHYDRAYQTRSITLTVVCLKVQ